MIGYRSVLQLRHAFGVEGRMRPRAEPASEPFIDATALDADSAIAAPAAPATTPSRGKPMRWVAGVGGLAILAVLAGVGYRWWHRPAPPPPEATVSREPPKVPESPSASVVRNPVPGETGRADLPPLADSDAIAAAALAELLSRDAVGRLFYGDGIIHRIVATVDNLPRQTVALRIMPVRPAPGAFAVTAQGGRIVAAPDNGARYAPYVRMLETVDTHKLVALYLRLYPLFQQAYVELGYPNGYFNDRLVEVIDDLLATPEPRGPVSLVQPKVVYQFADPELEALPAGQKILLRIGSANAAKVKAKLSDIRQQIARERPPAGAERS